MPTESAPKPLADPSSSTAHVLAAADDDAALRQLLDQLPTAAYTCDVNGLITYFNEPAAQLWGRAPRLNHSIDRYCGSVRIFSREGLPIPHDECFMALTLRDDRDYGEQEAVIERADGSRAAVLTHARPVRDAAGRLIGAVGIVLDVSSRVDAEFERAWLAAVVDSAADAIISKSLTGIIQSWNQGAVRIFGYTAAEALGRPILMLIPPDREQEEQEILDRIRRGQRVEHFRTVRVRKDGTRVDISLTVSPIRDARGRIIGASKIARDITEQVRGDFERARLAAIVDSADDAIISMNPSGIIQSWNQAAERIFSYTAAEAMGQPVAMLIPPDRRQEEEQNLSRIRRGERVEHYETVRLRKDGSPADVSLTVSPIRDGHGRTIGASKIARDISERKRAAEALRRREEELQLITDAVPVLIAYLDRELRYCFNNKVYETVFGRPVTWFMGKHVREALGEETYAKVVPYARRALAGETQRFEMWIRDADGGRHYYDVAYIPRHDRLGAVEGLVVLATDLTARKRAEEALQQSENTLLRAQQLANLGSYSYDVSTQRAQWSPQLYEIFGLDPAQYDPDFDSAMRCVHADDRARARDAFRRALAGDGANKTEVRIMRPDGSERVVLTQAEVVARDEAGRPTHVLGTVLDITERRQMERELTRAQNLESIGLLAGGIAHDFNNILTAVFGNIELAKLYAEDDSAVVEPLLQAEKAFKQARDLTSQLLTFSKGGAPICKVTPLAPLLHDSVMFALHGSNVRLHLDLAADLWLVNVDPAQMNQVLNNLVLNAKEAMPDGGHVRVTARNVALPEGNALALRAGRFVEVCIEDGGVGIREEHLRKVFDPYFTTKPRGTGLGLSTVYSILNRHDGHITVRSRPGVGTTFCFYLPASLAEDEAPPLSAPAGVRGRVLLMDDDAGVRRVGRALLEGLGYDVDTAADGQAAIERYEAARARGETFIAAILDLTIPGGMGGRECVSRLRELDPQVRALVSSGYFNDPVMSDYRRYGFCGVVPKPYQLEDLKAALARLAAGSP